MALSAPRSPGWFERAALLRGLPLVAALALGVAGGLAVAALGPLLPLLLLIGVAGASLVLLDARWGLLGALGVIVLLPFGTFPVKVGLTPTLLEGALGLTWLVFALRIMLRRDERLLPTRLDGPLVLFLIVTVFAFVLGLGQRLHDADAARLRENGHLHLDLLSDREPRANAARPGARALGRGAGRRGRGAAWPGPLGAWGRAPRMCWPGWRGWAIRPAGSSAMSRTTQPNRFARPAPAWTRTVSLASDGGAGHPHRPGCRPPPAAAALADDGGRAARWRSASC